MTKRDLIILVFRVFLIFNIISEFGSTFFYGKGLYSLIDQPNKEFIIYALIMTFVIFVVYLLLIKYTPSLVDKFNMADGFDNEELPIDNWDKDLIIETIVFVIGFIAIFSNIPALLYNLYDLAFSNMPYGFNSSGIIATASPLILGYLVIKKRRSIIDFLNR